MFTNEEPVWTADWKKYKKILALRADESSGERRLPGGDTRVSSPWRLTHAVPFLSHRRLTQWHSVCGNHGRPQTFLSKRTIGRGCGWGGVGWGAGRADMWPPGDGEPFDTNNPDPTRLGAYQTPNSLLSNPPPPPRPPNPVSLAPAYTHKRRCGPYRSDG